jgi:predicted ATP-grasp superfamily ATP-dependent carboligase
MAVHAETVGDFALHSRYLKRHRQLTPEAKDSEILSALSDLSRETCDDKPVLIATTDRYSQFICRNQHALSDGFLYRSPSAELCDTFLDKWKTAQICARYGIRAPTTRCPQTSEEIEAVGAALDFPVIVKPRYTFDPSFPGKNVIASNVSELSALYRDHDIAGRAVVQEIVPSGDGDIIVVAAYSNSDGKVVASYSGRRIRQFRPDFGAACFAVSERHGELESLSRNFLDSIGYQGFSMLEFARSRDDGQEYFIELNARMTLSNQLFADAGVDLTQIAYLDLTGDDISQNVGGIRQKDGVYWLDFARDLGSFLAKRRQGKIGFTQWLLSIARARSFAYWRLSDPLPFFFGCLSLVRVNLEKLMSTYDREQQRASLIRK